MADVEKAKSSTDAPKPTCSPASKMVIGVCVFVAVAGGAAAGIVLGMSKSEKSKQSSGSEAAAPCPVGMWIDDYGAHHIITETQWYSVSSWGTTVYPLTSCADGVAIGETPAYASYNAGDWNKFEFHAVGNDVAYCTSIYDAADEAAAIAADTSDIYDSSDSVAGCNGFPFTVLSPYELPISGSWTSDYGEDITITPTSFVSEASWGTSTYKIIGFGADFLIAQNDANASYNPNLWTLFKYDVKPDGSFSFCMIVYDGASAEDALITDISATYDAADAVAGCNGFAHTIASPA